MRGGKIFSALFSSPKYKNLHFAVPINFTYNIYMKKFDIFNQFRDAVIVVNKNDDVVYQNYTFKRWFENFTNLKKFSHNTNFNILFLYDKKSELFSFSV